MRKKFCGNFLRKGENNFICAAAGYAAAHLTTKQSSLQCREIVHTTTEDEISFVTFRYNQFKIIAAEPISLSKNRK
jgi:hypothetical protein